MRKLFGLLVILILPFAVALPASAAEVPPSEECLTLLDSELKKTGVDTTKKQDKEIANKLFEAGCIHSERVNYKKITPRSETCLALASQAATYFMMIN